MVTMVHWKYYWAFCFQREDVEQLFEAASDGNLDILDESISQKNIPVDITNEVAI